MQLGEAAQEPLPASVLDGAPWVPVMRKLMGDDAINLFTGAVVAEPGAADQPLHMDGGHLWQGTHGFEQPQCPPHCYNVFLPLVDVTAENGPTEFWPGSHVIGKARDAYDGGEPGVALAGAVGDIIVFDYRVVHREMANAATAARPVLYSTFSRPWFRDALNFPDDALFRRRRRAKKAAAAVFGGGGGKAKKKPAKRAVKAVSESYIDPSLHPVLLLVPRRRSASAGASKRAAAVSAGSTSRKHDDGGCRRPARRRTRRRAADERESLARRGRAAAPPLRARRRPRPILWPQSRHANQQRARPRSSRVKKNAWSKNWSKLEIAPRARRAV